MDAERRRLVVPGIGLALLGLAGALLALREPTVDRPAPLRQLVLVFGPTPTSEAPMPGLARFARAGRTFSATFAPHPDAVRSREAVLSGRLLLPQENEPSTVIDVLERRGFATIQMGEALPVVSSSATASALDVAHLARWLNESKEKPFFALVGLAPSLMEANWRASPDPTSPGRLPRIAIGDLPFGARPGESAPVAAWSELSRRRAKARHRDACQRADEQLGALLDALHRLAPDALVVYAGDPVPDQGQNGLLDRSEALFDGTLASFLALRGPGLPARKRPFDEPVTTLGAARTLLDLAGVADAPSRMSPSLLPRLLGGPPQADSVALSWTPRQAGHIGRSLRTADFRYTEWPDGSRELFDHREDPAERRNLAAVPALAGLLENLRRQTGEAEIDLEPPRPAHASRARRVVLLIVDDLKPELGSFGAPVSTPAMDSLAARGVRFSRAYATVAMCSPSRSTMLLGERPETTGIWDNEAPVRPPGVVPVQDRFRSGGFFTASVGKVFHEPEKFEWDLTDLGTGVAGALEEKDAGVTDALAEPSDGDDLSQPDGQRAQRAAQILATHAWRRLFLAVGLVRPHRRWIAPSAYFALYPAAQVQLASEPPGAAAAVPAIAIKSRAQLLPGVPLLGREPPGMVKDPAFRRDAVAAYRACVSFADAQVGRVLETLDRLRLWDDSIVILVGDNGYHLGDHGGLFRKDTLFEEALRVPLVVVAPGVRGGRVVDSPVDLLGLYRTLLDLGGLPVPEATPGRSLVPLLEGADSVGGRALSYRRVRAPEGGFSLRTGSHRYTLWPDGSEELYDLGADPAQARNLADLAASSPVKTGLRRKIETLVEAEGVSRP